jgi:predicted RNA-binding Zn ribbon-like protein
MTTRIGLGRVARDAVDYLSAGHSPRLRICAGVGCSTVFADRSGRRRFCPR